MSEDSEPTPFKTDMICQLFEESRECISDLETLLTLVVKPQDLAASLYQVHNFILNRREFCTDYAQMMQAKMEIFQRICDLQGLAHDHLQKQINIKRLTRKITLLSEDKSDAILRCLEEEALELEIQQEKFSLLLIQVRARGRLLEAREFFSVYQKYQDLDNLPETERAELEKEQWQTKSRYFPELRQRYNLTQKGFLPFEHEKEPKRKRLQ